MQGDLPYHLVPKIPLSSRGVQPNGQKLTLAHGLVQAQIRPCVIGDGSIYYIVHGLSPRKGLILSIWLHPLEDRGFLVPFYSVACLDSIFTC